MNLFRTVHLARNVAEKQRREFNSYISELANSVPLVANASKHSDDTNSSNLRRSKIYLVMINQLIKE